MTADRRASIESALGTGAAHLAVDDRDGATCLTLTSPVNLAGASELLGALVGADIPLPGELLTKAAPTLETLDVTLGGEVELYVRIGWPGTWTLLPGMLEVVDPGFTLSAFRDALTDDDGVEEVVWNRRATVDGKLVVFGLGLNAEVQVPSLRSSLRLTPDQHLTLGPLLDAMHLGGSPLDDVGLLDAQVLASPLDRAVLFSLSLGDAAWSLGKDVTLALQEVTGEVRYRGGDDGGVGITTRARLELEAGEQTIKLLVSAEHAAPGAGWHLVGDVTLDPPVGIVDLASGISKKLGGPAFDAPVDLEIAELGLTVDTLTRNLTFHAAGALALGDVLHLPLTLDLMSARGPDGSSARRVGGTLSFPIGSGSPLRFSAAFESRQAAAVQETLLGASYDDEAGTELGLGDLVGAVDTLDGDTQDALNALSFTLHRAGFAMLRTKGAAPRSRYLFKADVDGGIDISALPLVGDRLPDGFRLSLELHALYASDAFTDADRGRVRALLPGLGDVDAAAEKGVHVGVALHVGDQRISFDRARQAQAGMGSTQALLPPRPAGGAVPPVPAASTAAPPPPSVTWIPVQRRLGPISLQRVGVGFEIQTQKVTVLLDAALGLAGLELSLMGLGASYEVKTRALEFHLDGLGLSMEKGPVKLSGAFLRLGPDNFVGEARLQVAAWSLGALGAYTKVGGKTSVFIYAFINAPLGGPAFFFVQGLAFGFGYNRDLILPPVKEINAFPLVSEVMGTAPPAVARGTDQASALRNKLAGLDAALRPSVGQHFLAVGLKFESFKLVKCFALAAVSFGNELKFDIIGVATLEHPPESPVKLVFVELAFAIRIHPFEGFYGVEAALTSRSFILTPDCHLTGGAAFFAWAKTGDWHGSHVKAGDFVLTVGGYHPDYKVPAHYPKVDPLGLNWALTRDIWIKGGLYFAVTPDAMMIGGRMQAHFEAGPLTADFKLSIDFLMYWKPFHFEGRIAIECRIDFDLGLGSIGGSFGAKLEVWGPGRTAASPMLSGHARVHLGPVSASIKFGEAKAPPPPLTWDEFRASFIPAAPTGTRVSSGLIRDLPAEAGSDEKRFVVNPATFAVESHSVVPVTRWQQNAAAELHLPPMRGAGRPAQLASVMDVTLEEAPFALDDLTEHFKIEPVIQGFPAALWGGSGAAVVEAVGGIRLSPARAPTPGASRSVARSALSYTTHVMRLHDDDTTLTDRDHARPWAAQTSHRDLATALRDGTAARDALAAAFGVAGVSLDADRVVASFADAPRVVESVS